MFNATRSTGSRGSHANPYLFDDLFVSVHRSALGTAWRWRTELALLSFLVTALVALSFTSPLSGLTAQLCHLARFASCPAWVSRLAWGLAELAAVAGAVLGVPVTRRFLLARFWCVLARHRFQRLCWEARLHTRSGRLPAVLWVRPTKVGERLFVWCRAGIAMEDFAQHVGELRAACYARDARVTRNEKWSHLVTIDIIRRDTLAAGSVVHSPLKALIAHLRRTVAAPPPGPDWPVNTVPGQVISSD